MEIKTRETTNDFTRLEAVGKVTRNGWATGYEPIADHCGNDIYDKQVLLNLEAVKHIDSTGVEWLLASHKQFQETGGRLVLHSATPTVSQLLKMMRMHLVLNLANDEKSAMEKLANVTHGHE